MQINIVDFSRIKWVTTNYNTEYAQFSERKSETIWFECITNNVTLGVGGLVLMGSNARLSSVYVLPEHRGKGVAQELVKARINYAQENGFKSVDARTVKKYYESHGLVKIKDYKVGGAWYKKVF